MFKGDRPIEVLYSDKSGEMSKACKDLQIMPRNSLPGLPKNNAVIERTNRDILEGIRVVLVRAGLPACFWTYACYHYCLSENIALDENGESPWFKTHGYHFNGQEIPFEAAVIYRPADTVAIAPGKMEAASRTGIVAGYQIEYGYTWHKKMRV